jgi:hypothetical protein
MRRKASSNQHRKLWWWGLGVVLALELLLAYVLPESAFAEDSLAAGLVALTARFAAVVHNFDRVARHPEALSLYFAITFWLVIPKTVFWYWWLHSSERSNAKYFVISPLTRTRPASYKEFAAAPFVDFSSAETSRSMVSRVFWSCAIVLFWLLAFAVCVNFGWQGQSGPAARDIGFRFSVEQVAAGGIGAWLPWSLLMITFLAFLQAIVLTIVRDIWLLIRAALAGRRPPVS